MLELGEFSEFEVRQWFKTVDLSQARDTFRVVEGILEMREASKPKRVRRKDAGVKRWPAEPDIADQDRRLFESTLERG